MRPPRPSFVTVVPCGAISVLTDTNTQVLTSWIVSVDLPVGGGERKPRPATLALRRHRRPVEVRPPTTSSSKAEDAVAEAAAVLAAPSSKPGAAVGGAASARGSASNSESGHAKGSRGRASGRIGPRQDESGHGIGPNRRDPWAARLKRVRATLARARAVQDWLDCEPGRKAADVARREHLTRARICQLLRLLKLAPAIWSDIQQPGRTGAVLGELELRMLAPLPHKEQVRRYRALLGLDAPAPGDEPPRTAAKSARNRGLAAHLARARELHALVESGRFGSITAIGRHEGMSGTRVTQLLGLLDLHPEILAAIEAAGEDELGVKEKELRVIARMAEGKQLREWRKASRAPSC